MAVPVDEAATDASEFLLLEHPGRMLADCAGQCAQLRQELVTRLRDEPPGIGKAGKQERYEHDPEAGQPVLGNRLTYLQTFARLVSGCRLQPADHLCTIVTEMVGIGAQESHDIGLPGHRTKITFLQSKQIGRLDAQVIGDIIKIFAALLPGLAQMSADVDDAFGDGVQRGVLICRSA